jgi:hypothetical protein
MLRGRIYRYALATFLLMAAGCALPPDGNGTPNDNANINDNGNENENGGNDNDSGAVAELFARSSECAACHNGISDAADNDVSIETSWRATMMANAARDPYFTAKVSAEVQRLPALSETIEATCAKCHTPMAETQVTAEGGTPSLLSDGFLDPTNPLHQLAIDGVSCTLCHQIKDVTLGEEASFSGGYQVDTTTEKPERVNFGPYANPEQETMRTVAEYTPVLGEHVTESALCATCHTLFTPTVNEAGEVVGSLPEQTPFLEWAHSGFGDETADGRTCQDCHMPDADGPVVISTVPGGLEERSPFARHHFVGGNALMLRILRDHAAELDVQASAADFDTVISRVLDQLHANAGHLTIMEAALEDTVLRFDVAVENKAGHKFPTAFPARRLWLHTKVSDGTGSVVFESGAFQADGRIGGNDFDDAEPAVEPHYTLITDPGQVQVYESVMVDTTGEITFTLLRGAGYTKDNRLLPTGFDKATAGPDFATIGAALDDPDFTGGGDVVTYELDVAGLSGPFTVHVELLYQSISYQFVEDLRGVGTDLTEQFVGFHDEADITPTLIAEAEASVQ